MRRGLDLGDRGGRAGLHDEEQQRASSCRLPAEPHQQEADMPEDDKQDELRAADSKARANSDLLDRIGGEVP